MATYQEQIAKANESKTFKVMVLLAMLADLDKGLGIMVQEKIIDNEARIAVMSKFLLNHPEVKERLQEMKASRDAATSPDKPFTATDAQAQADDFWRRFPPKPDADKK